MSLGLCHEFPHTSYRYIVHGYAQFQVTKHEQIASRVILESTRVASCWNSATHQQRGIVAAGNIVVHGCMNKYDEVMVRNAYP